MEFHAMMYGICKMICNVYRSDVHCECVITGLVSNRTLRRHFLAAAYG